MATDHAALFAAVVNALGPEGHYSDLEPEGVARIQDADGEFHELRRDTLRAVLADLDEDHVLEERAELTRALGQERGRRAAVEQLLAAEILKLDQIRLLLPSLKAMAGEHAIGLLVRALDAHARQDAPQQHAERLAHQFETNGTPQPPQGPQRGSGDVHTNPAPAAPAHKDHP